MSERRAEFLETADRIGGRICRDAVWAGKQCNWFGWSAEWFHNEWTPMYRALGPRPHNPLEGIGLYAGTAGIALFLARLFRFTRDRIQRATLEGTINQITEQLNARDADGRCGMYNGIAGVAYALIETGQILGHDRLVQRGIDQLLAQRESPPNDELIDVIDGRAGAIPVLIDIARRFERNELLDIAAAYGEHLIKTASRDDHGWSWPTSIGPVRHNLLGYSHGAAGIVVALLQLYRVTNNASFLAAAREGLRYERHHFCAEEKNWPDFRIPHDEPDDGSPRFMIAWCHGAVGIGISRLRARQLLGDETELENEIHIAAETTQRHLLPFIDQPADDYCLCHGAAGNADFLLMAADQLERPEYRNIAESIGLSGIELIEQPRMPWPSNRGNGGETPTLMMGLAGIGYFYLRLYDSHMVPSILVVAPP